MNVGTWVKTNLVEPIVAGVVAGVVEGVLAGITTQADRVIDTTATNIEQSGADISADIKGVASSLTADTEGIVNGVLAGLKDLLPPFMRVADPNTE